PFAELLYRILCSSIESNCHIGSRGLVWWLVPLQSPRSSFQNRNHSKIDTAAYSFVDSVTGRSYNAVELRPLRCISEVVQEEHDEFTGGWSESLGISGHAGRQSGSGRAIFPAGCRSRPGVVRNVCLPWRRLREDGHPREFS